MSETLIRDKSPAPDGGLPDPARMDEELATSPEVSFLNYRQLTWRRFRKSTLGLTAGCVVIAFYMVAIFANFFAPYGRSTVSVEYLHMPPQALHVSFEHGLHVYGLKYVADELTDSLKAVADPSKIHPVKFFAKDASGQRKLMSSDGPMFLMGTDRMGRDLLSMIIYGSQISLTVGLIGVILSLTLGSLLGTLSGYCGGWVDEGVQRVIELLSAFPGLCLWMAIAAAVPPDWSPIKVYMGITVILSILGWGGLARQIRGKVLAYREQDFVMAAKSIGASHWHIITKHLLPGCYSHIIVISTMAVPGMILGETALSFLGIGIKPPMVSWGVLLNESLRVTVLVQNPWLLFPAIPVLLIVVSFNFLGDALRDAADPYTS